MNNPYTLRIKVATFATATQLVSVTHYGTFSEAEFGLIVLVFVVITHHLPNDEQF